jgi:hypothetical protein
MHVFNLTGKVLQLVIRLTPGTPPSYSPGHLFTAQEDPIENSSNYKYVFIKGRFDEEDNQYPTELGRQTESTAIITCPMLYKSLLQQTEYVDPLLNGSRWIIVSSITDEGRLFCTAKIKSVSAIPRASITQ